MARAIVLALAGWAAVAAGVVQAQSVESRVDVVASRPKFEVAAIKPSSSNERLSVQFAPGGRLVVTNATLRFLMKLAYDVNDDQIGNEPGWVDSKRYDVEAKGDAANADLGRGDQRSQTQVRLRLQSLLADRFGLRFRTEQKDMELYELVIAKHGSKLQAAADASAKGEVKGGRGKLTGVNATLGQLVGALGEFGGRPVVDKTELGGRYDFVLEWTPDVGVDAGNAATATISSAVDTGTGLATAIQEQLGLRLELKKSSADYLRFVGGSLPTEN